MKKLFATLLASIFVIAGFAQSSKIEGTWAQLNEDGTKIKPNVKCFLPDGKILGISFSEDLKNKAPWFIGTYEVLDDSTYIEHLTFHSSIAYQRDIKQSFQRLNDSVLITNYFNRYANGIDVPVIEGWKKMDFPAQEYAEHWDEMQQQALTMFERIPPQGKTVAQYGDELYKSFEQFKKSNNLDRANDQLLVRAELDTTNLEWQKDVLTFYAEIKGLPAIADKIANRYVRLAEQQAPTPTDTAVVNAYLMRGILYSNFGMPFFKKSKSDCLKSIQLTEASGRPYGKGDGVAFFMLAFSYLPEENHAKVIEYCDKALDIFENTPDVSNAQKGECYFLKGITLSKLDKNKEAIDILLHKAAPLYIDEQGKPMPKIENEIYPYAFFSFGEALCQNPKDKQLAKDYEQFMADKLLCGVTDGQNEKLPKGEYYIMEMGDWAIDGVNCFKAESNHYVMQKDGNHLVIDLNDNEKLGGQIILKTVDPSFKQQVIKNWKDYKKK